MTSQVIRSEEQMNIEEEIYSKLVEQFGIGEICIKKWGTRKQLTWIEFIKLALQYDAISLPSYSGFSHKDSFSLSMKTRFPTIISSKNKREWKHFLLSIVNKKLCYVCSSIKEHSYFGANNSTVDKLNSECKECRNIHYTSDSFKQKRREYLRGKVRVYSPLSKENRSKYKRNYSILNRASIYAYNAKRRAAKLQATPNWADQVAIKEIYQTCPEGYHVDHIIPLQNDLVCGLHCEFNLQHLSAHDNLSKGNKFYLT